MQMADRPTRFAVELLESAAVEGARHSRSAKQQLDHWVRIGRSVSMGESVGRRRIEAALAGSLELEALTEWERAVVHAEIDASVQARAQATSYGLVLAAEGVATVALDENGVLTRYHPDGTTESLG